MTLTTHAVIGGAIAGSLTHAPLAGLLLAFATHFAADAIPHWDYKLKSRQDNKEKPLERTLGYGAVFHRDLMVIGMDAFLGFLLITILAWLAGFSFWFIWFGAALGMLPDALQFAYHRLGGTTLTAIQYFHVVIMHAKSDLKDKPVWGIFTQLLLIAIIFYITLALV